MREYPPLTVDEARTIIDNASVPCREGGVQYAVWLAGEISDRTDLPGDTLTRAEELRDTLLAAAPRRIRVERNMTPLADVHAWLDSCDSVTWGPSAAGAAIVVEVDGKRQYVWIDLEHVPEEIL